jgi:CVNH domain.
MKKGILCVALTLSVLPVGYVNAQNTSCTTGDMSLSDCYDCSLFFFSNNILSCELKDRGSTTRGRFGIDNCVGNYEGQMVHGEGAGDSCKDYQLQDDILHAQCRTGAGV